MALINDLIKNGYNLFNVGVDKVPVNKQGKKLSKWESLSYEDLLKNHNNNNSSWGLRVGQQHNNKYIISLDFDCCGDKDQATGERLGCESTKKRLSEYLNLKDCDDGLYTSSTKGNMNLLIDITDCNDIIKHIETIGKSKEKLECLELFFNKCNQVIPPTQTKCKNTGEMGNARAFLNDVPFYVLTKEKHIYNFIDDMFKELLLKNGHTGTPKKKIKIIKEKKEINNMVENMEGKKKAGCKFMDLLFNIIDNKKNENGTKIIEANDWFQIAGILKHNNYDKNIWLEYSGRISTTNTASKKWDSINSNTPMNIFGLYNLAKKYNKEGFIKWMIKYNERDLTMEFYTTALIAEYFKSLYDDQFIFYRGSLYYFNGIYWSTDDKNYSFLKIFINNTFHTHLREYAHDKATRNHENKNIEHEDREKRRTQINDFIYNINKLRNIDSKNKFISELISYISKKDITEDTLNGIEWNKDHYLFAFNNKIINLLTMEERKPCRTDYISITAGYDYEEAQEEEKAKLNELFESIFKDEDVRDFYLTILATGLCGEAYEKFFVASGIGGNGKSLLNSLMMNTIGKYGFNLPNAILLNEFDGTKGNPMIYSLMNKRFVVCQEPDAKKKIKTSILKELTGGKSISARDNFQSTKDELSVKLSLTLIMECNDKPLLDSADVAMVRRVHCVPFESVGLSEKDFTDKTEEEIKENNYFKIDTSFKSAKFQDKHRHAFFEILCEKLIKHVERNKEFNIPKKCEEMTTKYMANSDALYSWFCANYEKQDKCDEDKTIIYELNTVYDEFKSGDLFDSYSKDDKRKYNKSYFKEFISKNIFLKNDIKKRKTSFNKEQLTTDCIIGWLKINPEDKKD